jgi:hypothetical protein
MIEYIGDARGDYVRFSCDHCRRHLDIPVATLDRPHATRSELITQATDRAAFQGWSSEPSRGEFCRRCATKGAPAGGRGPKEGGNGR